MTTSPLTDAFEHHIWACERLLDACANLTPAQLEQDSPGTYGPISKTLHHLVQADRWYLRFYPSGAGLPKIDEDDTLSVAELRAAISANRPGWTELLASGVDPDEDVVERGDGWEFHAPTGIRLAQVLHHGTDHRSQVCTALTRLGIEPPDIAVWAYGDAAGRNWDVPPKA